MMVGVGSMAVMRVLADATNTIAEGEVLQLMNCHDADIDEERYLRVIRFKTAKLFEAASRLGAILGGVESRIEQSMASYGMHLGTAFQLIDDVLDYSGDLHQTGKNLGDDLAEGKATLPLIYAMRTGSPEQAALIRAAIERGGTEEFPLVLRTIQETGALEYTRARAAAESGLAVAMLEPLAPTRYKECLLQLADFAVTRTY
jgi:octaprenyl-diphosphate synthase